MPLEKIWPCASSNGRRRVCPPQHNKRRSCLGPCDSCKYSGRIHTTHTCFTYFIETKMHLHVGFDRPEAILVFKFQLLMGSGFRVFLQGVLIPQNRSNHASIWYPFDWDMIVGHQIPYVHPCGHINRHFLVKIFPFLLVASGCNGCICCLISLVESTVHGPRQARLKGIGCSQETTGLLGPCYGGCNKPNYCCNMLQLQ